MVCLQEDEDNFEELMKTYNKEYSFSIFRDSDLNNMITAIAFEPMTKKDGDRYMSKLKLA